MLKCPHSTNCVSNLEQCENKDLNFTDIACPPDNFWRCHNGQCLSKRFVCDFNADCEDGSDEVEGCNLFEESQCKSWNGLKHEKCQNDTTICTLPQYKDSDCRACDKVNQTRCNDGWCIDNEKFNDGVADCEDRSDEDTGMSLV